MSWQEAAIRWYSLLLFVSWGFAPAIAMLCPRLADRGMGIARPLILVMAIYPSWLAAATGLLPYSTRGLWATLAVGSSVAWGVAIRRQIISRDWLLVLLRYELLALLAFAGYLWMRGFTPEILNTEKPMDIAFLSASERATTIPPIDPWFAGEPINYYYLGYLLHGALARMAQVPATIGFNLALATTFSMAVVATVGVTFDAVRPWVSARLAEAGASLAALSLVLFGNLYTPMRLLTDWDATIDADWWSKQAGVGWRSSRIVCDGLRVYNDCPRPAVETINEFPYFSFLLGDLHPHVMALPVTIAVLGLAFNLLLRSQSSRRMMNRSDLAIVAATGAFVGSLYALNSWDLPTYLLVVLVSIWIGFSGVSGKQVAITCGLAIASAVLAWLPFLLSFEAPTGGPRLSAGLIDDIPLLGDVLLSIGIQRGERTSVAEFLTMFGISYLVGLWLIVHHWLVYSECRVRLHRGLGGFVAIIVIAAILLPLPLLVIAGMPLVGAVLLLWRSRTVTPANIAIGCFALGFALLLVVELFYIRDAFNSRMNTLFKVYYQVWVLFAIATAMALVSIWRQPRFVFIRPTIAVGAVLMLVSGLSYPLVASRQWTDSYAEWTGLDGAAFLGQRAPDEAAAIRWLADNARPGDVVLEAAGCSYQPNGDIPTSRVSAFTGVPTVIGWKNHEEQWRSGQPVEFAEIAPRAVDVAEMFADPNGTLSDQYGVTLLFIGRYEESGAGAACRLAGPYDQVRSAEYPGAGWSLAFGQGEVRIFQRQGG